MLRSIEIESIVIPPFEVFARTRDSGSRVVAKMLLVWVPVGTSLILGTVWLVLGESPQGRKVGPRDRFVRTLLREEPVNWSS